MPIERGLLFERSRSSLQYRWHAHKPFYILRFAVIEPKESAGYFISGRLYCTPKALWKLSWFLRDFGYDTESLGRDEIDEKNLVGLQGLGGGRSTARTETRFGKING